MGLTEIVARGVVTLMGKRAERRWTIMLVPHSSGPSRAVEVSHTIVRSLKWTGGVALLAFLVLGVAMIGRAVSVTRYRLLDHENRLLVDEVYRVGEQLGALRDSLEAMGQRGQELRLLADLSPLDPAVQRGGIGGPPGEWPERDSLVALGPHGAQALAARVDLDELARRANILARSLSQAHDSLSSHEARFAATPSIMPTHGRVSSPFSPDRVDPILHIARPHQGMDVATSMGAEIEAAASGVVVGVRWENGYGNLVTIDHGYGVVTRYAHCSKILVVRGQHVKRGQTIALVGSTGESTGPHVHYEVWVNGKAVDPKKFVLPDGVITD
jgi:murein DD-endopeptidase MepM/ murein hydrolase activator NlpD